MPVSKDDEIFKTDLRFSGDFKSTSQGDLATVSGIDNLRQAIVNRLVTRPGTLAHRPEYGIGILDFQGQIGDLQTQRDIMIAMQEQFDRDEPRIQSLDGLSIDQNERKPSQFTIRLIITAIGNRQIELDIDPFSGI